MVIVFQRPSGGDDAHDYTWALLDGAGDCVSWHYSPEAALLAAIGVLGIEAGTLRLERDGADRFNLVPCS